MDVPAHRTSLMSPIRRQPGEHVASSALTGRDGTVDVPGEPAGGLGSGEVDPSKRFCEARCELRRAGNGNGLVGETTDELVHP
jgi:hypothetical protein